MKRAVLSFFIAATCAWNANSQITYPAFSLNWGSSGYLINQPVKQFTDSIYRTLVPGTSVKMALLTPAEAKLPELERALLSYRRAEELVGYFRSQRIPQKEFDVEMVPFHQPHRLRSSEITSRSYRSFMSRKSESFFLIHRGKVHATSQAQLQFDASITKEQQHFSISAEEQAVVTLASGTEFHIPANCLVTMNGHAPKSNNIDVKISEYSKADALVMKNMTTTCGGRMLQSNGMWHVGFSSEGEALKVAPGKNYAIKVDMIGKETNMKVFTGVMKNGMIDWKLEDDGSVQKVTVAGASQKPVDQVALTNKDVSEEVESINTRNWNNNRNDKRYQLNANVNFNDEVNFETGPQYVTNRDMYEMKLNDVGFINCDAFVEVAEKTDLVVQVDTVKNLNVMLVFLGRKSVLPGYACAEPGMVKFTQIPANETALLVVYKKTDDGKVMKFTRRVTAGNEKTILASLKPSTQDALTGEINGAMAD